MESERKFDKEWWEDFRNAEVTSILALTADKNNDYTGGRTCDTPFANARLGNTLCHYCRFHFWHVYI